MDKEYETVQEHCKHPDCSYRKTMSSIIPYCDYIGATGKRRGCKISECNKYTTSKVYYPAADWVHLRDDQSR